VESVKCIHLVALSLEKALLEIKVISNNNNEDLLEDIYEKLEFFEFHHINVEIQKPEFGHITGSCCEI